MGNQQNVVRPKGLEEGRPAPEFRELNAKDNFGSATKEVLKTTNSVMGGSKTRISGMDGVSGVFQTARPDDPNSVLLPLGRTPSDFQVKQIPNTGPKFAPADDNRVRPETT